MLRDELYDAVYSNEYTTVPPKKGKSRTSYIQRIPYFVLVNRVFDERDKNADQLQANITALENKLNDKDKQLEECNQNIDQLKKSLKESSDKIYNMEIEMENNNLEQRKLEANIQYEQMMQQAAKDRSEIYNSETWIHYHYYHYYIHNNYYSRGWGVLLAILGRGVPPAPGTWFSKGCCILVKSN